MSIDNKELSSKLQEFLVMLERDHPQILNKTLSDFDDPSWVIDKASERLDNAEEVQNMFLDFLKIFGVVFVGAFTGLSTAMFLIFYIIKPLIDRFLNDN